MVTIRMGPMLPTFDPLGVGLPDLAAACRQCEDLGFDSIWVGDHLAFNSPILESSQVLATAAATTSRLTIGFSVLLLALRNPAWAAKQIATLQFLSDRRLVLGVGVGGENEREWEAAGVDPRTRGARTDAVLDALPRMLAGHATSVLGVAVPALLPATSMPDVWIGGRSDAALRRAVRSGTHWLSAFADARRVGETADRLGGFAAEASRAKPAVAATVFVHVTEAGAQQRRGTEEAGEYLQAQYGLSWERAARFCVVGDIAKVADELLRFIGVGVTDFVLMPAAARFDEQADRLARVRQYILESVP